MKNNDFFQQFCGKLFRYEDYIGCKVAVCVQWYVMVRCGRFVFVSILSLCLFCDLV